MRFRKIWRLLDDKFNESDMRMIADTMIKSLTESPVVIAGPLSVDLVNRTVALDQTPVRLTRSPT